MGDSLDILESVLEKEELETLSTFLSSCQENRAFYHKRESLGSTVGLINASLNEASSRERGLLLLDKALSQLPAHLLAPNLVSWVRQVVKAVRSPGPLSAKASASQVLDKLLTLSDQYPEVRKDLALNVIPKSLDTLLTEIKKDNEVKFYLLDNLVTVLKIFGRSCNNQKRSIERVLLSQLKECDAVVQLAAQSYLQLAHVGGPSTEGANYKAAWKDQQLVLISALHNTLDKLFENVNEIQGTYDKYKKDVDLEGIEYSDDPSPVVKFQEMSHVFSSLTKYLASLYLGAFPVSKCVVVEGLLSVVCRCLAVTVPSVMKRVSAEAIALSAQLPTLHKATFQLLDAFIKCCGVNLISHVHIISRLFSQTLKWTQVDSWPYGQDKPFNSLRESVYSCLTTWLVCLRSCSGVEKYASELVVAFVKDIHYHRPNVTLNLQSSLPKGKLGKKRKLALLGSRSDDHKLEPVDKRANSRLCAAALASLPPFLEATSTLIPPRLHRDLQEVVVKKLLDVQNDSEGTVIPYSDDTCRLRLYGAFTALCINNHPKFSAPVPFAVQILNNAIRDPSQVVSSFCSLAVNIVEKIVRPSIDSFLNIRTVEASATSPSTLLGTKALTPAPIKEVQPPSTAQVEDALPPPQSPSPLSETGERKEVENSTPFPAMLVDEDMSDFDVEREYNGVGEQVNEAPLAVNSADTTSPQEVCLVSSGESDSSVQVVEVVKATKRIEPSSSPEESRSFFEERDPKKIKLEGVVVENNDEDDLEMLNSFVDAVTDE